MTIDKIASIVHEANRAYRKTIGEDPGPNWAQCDKHTKLSAIEGVRKLLDDPSITPEQAHESWLEFKRADGWSCGPVKDLEKKEHPCFVPYSELPPAQRAKDHLFRAIVLALAPFATERQESFVEEAQGGE